MVAIKSKSVSYSTRRIDGKTYKSDYRRYTSLVQAQKRADALRKSSYSVRVEADKRGIGTYWVWFHKIRGGGTK